MNKHDLVAELSSALSLSPSELLLLAARAPHSYKIYTIDKKTGGKRTIAQPARQTKYIQNLLIEKVLKNLPVHECAAAYQPGSSIKKNAIKHKDNAYLAKFDLIDFFGSITNKDLTSHFNNYLLDKIDSKFFNLIARFCCITYKGQQGYVLSIGAPTSPLLSNSVMYEFDVLMHNWCHERNITYTRYADDLTFSSNSKDVSFVIEEKIVELLNTLKYPKLQLNRKKTVYSSKKNQRRITGLIITNEGKISLGRERKRTISAMIHKFSLGQLSAEDLSRLQGLLGLAEDVEPIFSSRMRAKYGIKIISEIFQHRAPPQKINR